MGPSGSAESVELRPEPTSEGVYVADWSAEKPGSYVVEVLAKRGEEETVLVDNVKQGTGRPAKKGDTVSILYTGTLVNGQKFDSTADHGQCQGPTRRQ